MKVLKSKSIKNSMGYHHLGNIVSFALVGIVVDAATGAVYSLEPADEQANLDKLKNAGLLDNIPKNENNEMTVIMLTREESKEVKAIK